MITTERICLARFSLPCLLLFLFLANPAFALNPERHISQYGHTAWRVQDGFFGAPVRSVTQTTDGYIWVGTEAGLFRFDGVRYVSWSSQQGEQLPSNVITALLGARDGSLWIGTDAGLAHWANQRLITYPKEGGFVSSILQDAQGEIWMTRTRHGDNTQPLCQVASAGVRCYGNEDGVPAFVAGAIAQDHSGNFWIGGDTTLLRWRPGSSTIYRPKGLRSNAGADGVEALSVAADGSLLVGMAPTGRGLGLQHLVDGTLKSFVAQNLNSESLEVSAVLEDQQNSVWVATFNQGIYKIRGNNVDHYRATDGLSSDFVLKFYKDREGNLWVATAKGLDCFRDLRVTSFSAREGLSTDAVDSVLASRDGAIWIGNASNLDVLGPGGEPSQVGKALHGHQVTSLLEDHAGRLWAGIDNTLSIYQGKEFSQIKREDGSPIGMVMGLTEDSENNVWAETVGPPVTLIRIRDRKVQEEFPAPQMPLARKIVADPQSGIWLGLLNGDLARYRSGKTEIFRFTHYPDSRVNQLIARYDGSILGATAFGVVGWKNEKKQVLTVRNGLPCNNVHALISDNHGDLWLHAQCGLIQIANSEVQRWGENPEGRLQVRVFDGSDGVQPGQGHFNASARSPDGRLWFANGSVLQMVDPAHLAGNAVAPPVHINAIIADRKSYSPQELLSLPPLMRDLEIDYTALSFIVPQKVFFRYMLEGHDASWQEPGTRRQAFYSDLRPGHYRFRVIACNNDGVWNEAGATLNFNVVPAWYQTNWFRFLSAFAVLFVTWSLYRLRLRQMTASTSARFDERLAERTRMARELHDTFLQTVQGSKLVADDALERSNDRVRMHQALEQLSVWLAQAIQEGRAALNSLRTSTTQRNDLADALHRATENGFVPRTIAIKFAAVGDARDMHPVVRDEVYRIGYEAIRNACLHSSATQLEIELRYSHELTLRVGDNGIGIDPAIAEKGKDGHFGLQGMRERAARIGGKLTVITSAFGTEIKLIVPGGIIFRTSSPNRHALYAKMRTLFRLKGQDSNLD
jgi:signal transduction histidine kinase/ligand-binding sensor domain-containing protein